MIDDLILATVAPDSIERCRRLEFALMLVRNGTDPGEARRLVQERFSVSYWTAWRVIDTARDMGHNE